ncbi:MAG: GNAT family N-acetyltransferase [Anaerobacillus sp.]
MKNVTSTNFDGNLAELVYEWTMDDEIWLAEEFGRQPMFEDVMSYIQTYEGIGCKFQIWFVEDEPIGMTSVLEVAPSNHKAWIGTIVVRPDKRSQGYGRKMMQLVVDELTGVVFAGIPYEMTGWSLFLGKCGFEQYGLEEDKKKYLLFVRPD